MTENGNPKILVLTPIYPGEGMMKSTTNVVHYFVREWVNNGIDVRVIHFPYNFPSIINIMATPFRRIIGSKAGYEIRTWKLKKEVCEIEGVRVCRLPLQKTKPHGRYNKREIMKIVKEAIFWLESEHFIPDIITAHWVNPQLEVLHELKKQFDVKTCYVAHDLGIDLKGIYKNEVTVFLKDIDLFGYRSEIIKNGFEKTFDCGSKPSFLCYSGVPESYLTNKKRKIKKVRNILFVGTLISRKYPIRILEAAHHAFGDKDYQITYVGTGNEELAIRKLSKEIGVENKIHLLGRLTRNEVVNEMDKNELFVMISRRETFGLVYLEAMARGCITIASRNEGFDGIIIDGVNGFLCKAGDAEELAFILNHINSLSEEEINRISESAMQTAAELTDKKVADVYYNNLNNLCKY